MPKISLDPKVLREAAVTAGGVMLQSGLESKIGARGCAGEPFQLVGSGVLRSSTSAKPFRVVCDWGVFAIHPEDAGWVLRAVEAFMPVKPVWMKSSRRFFRGGKWVSIPAGFTFQPTMWTCPDCIPKQVWKNQEVVGYDNTKCDPCDASKADDGLHTNRVSRFGYDNRVMQPWTLAKYDYLADYCGRQPGGADTICLPRTLMQGNDNTQRFCSPLDGADLKYRAALWASAGIAIRAYHAAIPAMAQAAKKLSGVGSAKPNYVPAMVAAALTGVGALLIWRRR